MLSFSPVRLEDKAWVDPLVFAEDSRSAGFNFGNVYMWSGPDCHQITRFGDRLLILVNRGETPHFVFPVGSGALLPTIEALQEYAAQNGFPFLLRGLTAEQVEQLESVCPGRFTFEKTREYFDYIYAAGALASLAGKKLHGKRNHINRFEAQHNWHVQPLSADHFPACLELLASWESEDSHEDTAGEHAAIVRGFRAWETLGLEGVALFAGSRLVAFTVGEKISSDTFNVHFEKAYRDVNGAYPMVNREFVRQVLTRHPEILYINREEDMGHENLRLAKQSYNPLFLVEKSIARRRDAT